MTVRLTGPVPYAPPQAVLKVIARRRGQGSSAPLTKENVAQAGVAESLAPRTLTALRQLGLVDEWGEPSASFKTLLAAPEEEFRNRLAEVLREAYAEVFEWADPATDPPSRIREAFERATPHGQRPRMATLFYGLCKAAGIVDAMPTRSPVRGTPISRKGAGRRSSRPDAIGTLGRLRPALPAPVLGLLETLPKEGTGWTRDQRDAFLSTFAVVLDYSFPIVEAQPESEEKESSD